MCREYTACKFDFLTLSIKRVFTLLCYPQISWKLLYFLNWVQWPIPSVQLWNIQTWPEIENLAKKRNNIRIKIALETAKIGTQTIPGVFFQFRVFCRYISYFEVPISYNRVMTFLKGIIKNAFIPVKTWISYKKKGICDMKVKYCGRSNSFLDQIKEIRKKCINYFGKYLNVIPSFRLTISIALPYYPNPTHLHKK